MTRWWPVRQRLVAAGVAVAAVTAGVGAVLGGGGGHVWAAAGYLAVTVAATLWPTAVGGVILVGVAWSAHLLVTPGGPAALFVLPVVVGVVATAELMAEAVRLDTPFECRADGAMAQAVAAAGVAGGVFAAVVLVAGLVGTVTGPTGLVALALASAACVGLAAFLVRSPSAGPDG